LSDYFFIAPKDYPENVVKKQWKEDTSSLLEQLIGALDGIDDFSPVNLENEVKAWIGEQGFSFAKILPPLRLVIVGDMKGPHLFDIMALIGKQESMDRIAKATKLLL